ncbi:MAG TPA: alpha/beta fold hydrolase, partial [Candidatus Acidoferrales bacterium]|nr:alpha/beta fold hydrolase [Candidatus Acidoferrales bacterium]
MHSREAFLSAIFVVFCAVPIANAASAVTVQSESLKPWSVPSEVNVEHKEITFSSKGARLRGTLYFASSAQHRPAVVVLHGASSPSSNLPLYRHLEEILPPLGINVFVFDRRGSGASEGGGEDSYNFDILADDGIAAATALGSDEHVDRNHIGYWGISQGGWLALLAASKDAK